MLNILNMLIPLFVLITSTLAQNASNNSSWPPTVNNTDLSGLFVDLTPLDVFFLVLVILLIVMILGYLIRQGQRSRARLRDVRLTDARYAQHRLDIQSAPIAVV